MGGEKPVYENACKLNLMVWRGGKSRILCCYKYVKVILTSVFSFLYITRSVSLVYVRFLRNELQCHCTRVWCRWPVVIWRFSTQ